VVVTQLDKAWCRTATAKLIRQGKLKRRPCAVCGARETFVHHIDSSDPERIDWLCKRHKSEESLSALQRELLKSGLHTWYRRPLDLACGVEEVACFRLKGEMSEITDRRERARRRAAAGLAIARLIRRGLLEHYSRGHWRLTRQGLALARRLYPEIKPRSKRELAGNIALHRALKLWEAEHKRPRRHREKKPPNSTFILEDV
jgi:hypothetical protein